MNQRPSPSILPMSALPDLRSHGLPGHDPSLNPPQARPTAKTIKKVVKCAPKHDPSVSPSSIQPTIISPTKPTSNVRGHVPQYSTPVTLPHTNETTRYTGDSPGRDSSTRPSPSLQPGRPGLAGTSKCDLQPVWRWRSLGRSATNSSSNGRLQHVVSKESNNTRQTSHSNNSDAGVLPVSNAQTKRPWTTVSSNPLEARLPLVRVPSRQTRPGVEVCDVRELKVQRSVDRSNALQTSKPELVICRSRTQLTTSDHRIALTGIHSTVLGAFSQVVRSVSAHVGGVFSRALLAVAGGAQLLWSLGPLSEHLIHNSLSFTGRQLMSAKKGCNPFKSRLSYWPAGILNPVCLWHNSHPALFRAICRGALKSLLC